MLACRPGCGACCIAPSISASLPALPHGKPAGERCPHLTAETTCALFGSPDRPAVCASLRPSPEMCGDSPAAAMAFLVRLEALTAPRDRGGVSLVPAMPGEAVEHEPGTCLELV